MCNCGNKRAEYSQPVHAGSDNARVNPPVQTLAYARFEYIGKTALTVTGNITGMQYRFNSPGNRQNIDFRDVPGLMGIPVLKKVG